MAFIFASVGWGYVHSVRMANAESRGRGIAVPPNKLIAQRSPAAILINVRRRGSVLATNESPTLRKFLLSKNICGAGCFYARRSRCIDFWRQYIAAMAQEQRAFRWCIQMVIRFSIVQKNDRLYETDIAPRKLTRLMTPPGWSG